MTADPKMTPRTAASLALLDSMTLTDEERIDWEHDLAAIEAEAADSQAVRLLAELADAVTALENRAIRSGGEFHVWAEERMVTEARDEARGFLAALKEQP